MKNLKWTSFGVINWCISRNFYTMGCNSQYDRMLDFVEKNPVTPQNVRLVVIDIISHSNCYSIFQDGDIDYIANEIWNNVVVVYDEDDEDWD